MKHHTSNYGDHGGATQSRELDLFNYSDRYPHAPAARATDTSRAAAESVKSRAATLREKVLEEIRKSEVRSQKSGGGMTADEVAWALKETVLTIRPRVAELHAERKIGDTGLRRENESGHKAIVWKSINAES